MKSGLLATSLWLAPPGLRYTHSNLFLTNLSQSRYWPCIRRFCAQPTSCTSLSLSSLPQALFCLPAHLAFCIRQPLRCAVGLVVEPEDILNIHAINTCQRLMAERVAVDVGERHIIANLANLSHTCDIHYSSHLINHLHLQLEYLMLKAP